MQTRRKVGVWIGAGLLALGLGSSVSAQGLRGDYYSGTNFGTWQASRTDSSVGFTTFNDEDMPEGMGVNQFSVRWIGQVVPRYSESHTFFLNTDDGSRLWIDGELVIDGWSAVSNRNAIVSGLVTDRPVEVMIEVWQGYGGRRAIFEWESATQVREVITNDRLVPGTDLGSETVVRLYITGPETGERSTDRGTAVVSRFGPLDEELTVSLTIGGDAVPGEDYAPFDAEVVIPAGRTSASFVISVLDDAVAEPDKAVTFALNDSPDYRIDASWSEGEVVINDDDGVTGPEVWSIVGSLDHGGASAGYLVAVAWSDAARTQEVGRAVLVEPGIYSIPGLDAGEYYVSGFLDEDRDGEYDEGEPRLDADPVQLPPDALQIDFDFSPDCDAPDAPPSCDEPDAGMSGGEDAGDVPGEDAGAGGDTSEVADAGEASPNDGAGGSGGGDDGGCAQVGGGSPAGGAVLVWCVLGWAWMRRRRVV